MMDLGELLAGSPEEAAPGLLGSYLVTEVQGRMVRARVTEVEAYKGFEDPASHAYRGRTKRNNSMFERPGTLYVYRSYGVHWCANVSAGPEGVGWGILFRGAEIVDARRDAGRGLSGRRGVAGTMGDGRRSTRCDRHHTGPCDARAEHGRVGVHARAQVPPRRANALRA